MNSPNDADYYDLASEYERVCDELDAIKREWIDPQRIVELAKRYTDEGKTGWVELHFQDRCHEWSKPWYVVTPGNRRASIHEALTANEALKGAEA